MHKNTPTTQEDILKTYIVAWKQDLREMLIEKQKLDAEFSHWAKLIECAEKQLEDMRSQS